MGTPKVHTTFNKAAGNWRNISEGASKPSKVFETKAQAQAAGRQIAINNKVEHLVHKVNGQIGERNSYGNDPRKSKG